MFNFWAACCGKAVGALQPARPSKESLASRLSTHQTARTMLRSTSMVPAPFGSHAPSPSLEAWPSWNLLQPNGQHAEQLHTTALRMHLR